MKYTIYHNPRCSKSRQTLALLEDAGISPQIVTYLDQKLTQKQLKEILSLLGIKPSKLLRKGEKILKEEKVDISSEDAILKAMAKYPILIERPIVVSGKRAILGRPPENVKDLF